jgi:hypothetical protein
MGNQPTNWDPVNHGDLCISCFAELPFNWPSWGRGLLLELLPGWILLGNENSIYKQKQGFGRMYSGHIKKKVLDITGRGLKGPYR